MDKKNIKNIYKLSPMQEGMLFHSIYEDSSLAYFHQELYAIDSHISPQNFKLAWQKVVDRHDAFRTLFVYKDVKEPIQIVLKSVEVDFVFEDFSALSFELKDTRWKELIKSDRDRGFVLNRANLIRFILVKIEEDRYRLIFTFHHIIADGWCQSIFFRDFMTFYLALEESKELNLPAAPQFIEYIRWLKDRDSKKSLEYWCDRLKNIKKGSSLGKESDDFSPIEIDFEIDRDNFLDISKISQELNITINEITQAILGVTISALTYNSDISFGVIVSGRPAQINGVENIIGNFINIIPFRVLLDRDCDISSFLKDIHKANLESTPHHYLPLSEILASINLKESLFDTILVFENYPNSEGGSSLKFERIGAWEANNYALTIQASIEESSLKFRVIANKNSISTSMLNSFKDRFLKVSKEIVCLKKSVLDIANISKKSLSLYVSSSFTIDPLEPYLDFFLDRLNFEYKISIAPYNTTLLEFANSKSALYQNSDISLIAFRFEDLIKNRDYTKELLRDSAYEFIEMLKSFNGATKIIFTLFPLMQKDERYIIEYNNFIEKLKDIEKLTILDLRDVDRFYGISNVFDMDMYRSADIPFGEEFYSAFASEAVKTIMAYKCEPHKVICVDCDNTLWSGVVGEDGVFGIEIDENRLKLQKFLIQKVNEGFLIALVSKNNIEDVLEVFRKRDDMLLKMEHIVATKINWERKSQNIIELSSELNLGLDSFVFIDDNKQEVLEVLQNAPLVLSIWLDNSLSDIDIFINKLWALQKRVVTKEDRVRTAMYKSEQSRREVQTRTKNFEEFLDALELRLNFAEILDEHIPRISQMTFRTNQFNSTTIRMDEDRVKELKSSSDCKIFGIWPEDRFGDYGLSGAIFCKEESDGVVIFEYLLSCRVLGKDIEKIAIALLQRFFEKKSIFIEYKESLKNRPFRDYLESIETTLVEDGDLKRYRVDRAPNERVNIKVVLEPKAEKLDIDKKDESKYKNIDLSSQKSAQSSREILKYDEMLTDWRDYYTPFIFSNAQKIIKKLKDLGSLSFEGDYVEPKSDIEREICLIFGDILNIDRYSATNSFFDLGGHSLKAIRAISKINLALKSDISIKNLYQNQTPRELASLLEKREGSNKKIEKAPFMEHYPTMNAQKRSYLIWQLNKNSTAYNIPMLNMIKGEIDLDIFRKSIAMILDRHEILRTNFKLIDNSVVQVILNPSVDEVFKIESIKSRDKIDSDLKSTFDLERDLLFRVFYYELDSANSPYLLFLFHHSIFDGWSIDIFAHELLEIYNHLKSGNKLSLEPLEIQNRDIAYSERSIISTKDREYWHLKLGGSIKPLDLPIDYPREELFSNSGKSISVTLDDSLFAKIDNLSSGLKLSKFTILVALYKTVLFRITTQDDILVAIPNSNRDRVELENQIGFFVNTLLIRDSIDKNTTLRELIDMVNSSIIDAIEHSSYPFDALVNEIDIQRDPSRNPGYDASISYLEMSLEHLEFDGFSFEPIDVQTHSAQCDLAFEFFESKSSLVLKIVYQDRLFTTKKIETIRDLFFRLIEISCDVLDEKLSKIDLLKSEQKARVVEAQCGKIEEVSIDGFIDMLDIDFEIFSYKDNLSTNIDSTLINRLKNRFSTLPKNSNIVIFLDRDVNLVASLIAIFKCGHCYVPIEKSMPKDRVLYIIDDCKPSFVLSDIDGYRVLKEYGCANSIEKIEELKESGEINSTDSIDKRDNAYIIYTSGTTGRPKGVKVAYEGIVNLSLWYKEYYALDNKSILLLMIPATFDSSVKIILLSSILRAKLVLFNTQYSPKDIYNLIDSQKVTIINCVPSAFKPIVEIAHKSSFEPLRSLKHLSFGGESLNYNFFKEFSQKTECAISNVYGPTETTDIVTSYTFQKNSKQDIAPIGKPIYNAKVFILDRFQNLLPQGFVGELYLGGVSISNGYINSENSSKDSFLEIEGLGEFYRSGDFARFDSDFNIIYISRKDNQIKINGNRVEIDEIKRVLLRDLVHDCEVIYEDGELYLFYSSDLDIEELIIRRRLKESLPAYMIPSYITQVDMMPINRNGKVDREALLKKVVFETSREFSDEALLEIWRGSLGDEKFGMDDNFFKNGGNSIVAISLSKRLSQFLEISVNPSDIFLYQTPRLFLRHLSDIKEIDFIEHHTNSDTLLIFFPSLLGVVSWDTEYMKLIQKIEDIASYIFLDFSSPSRYMEILGQKVKSYKKIFLCGFSSGGLMAIDALNSFDDSTKKRISLILIDSTTGSNRLDKESIDEIDRYYSSIGIELRDREKEKLNEYIEFINSLRFNDTLEDFNIYYIFSQSSEIDSSYMNEFVGEFPNCNFIDGFGQHFEMLLSQNIEKNSKIVFDIIKSQLDDKLKKE